MQPVTFLEALQFARQRNIVLADEFYSLDLNTRQMATTVKLLSSIEQVGQVIKQVNKALSDGSTYADFKKALKDSDIVLPDHYLRNVFRTNIQTAYANGRWIQQYKLKDKRPYLVYSAINDSRVRPAHLAMNRIILHIDHPFWQTWYPPNSFQCRCTVMSLTEKQALKQGITKDEDLPSLALDDGWSSSPIQFGDLQKVLDEKIASSTLDKALLTEQKKQVEIEWKASKKLSSLLEPMSEQSRDLFNVVADAAIQLDPTIRPSALKVFVDYVQGNHSALSTYLSAPTNTLADDVIRRWLIDDMSAIEKVATNTVATVSSAVTLQQIATYQVGQTVQMTTPMLAQDRFSDVLIRFENVSGIGIDLAMLNAGQGVLIPIGLSFEVVAIETIKGQLTYTLSALRN